MTYTFMIIVVGVVVGVLAIETFTGFEIDDLHYERLKRFVLNGYWIVAFIEVLIQALDPPFGEQTKMIVVGIFAMLSGMLGISAKNYYSTRSTHEMTDEEAFDALAEYDDLYDEVEAYEDEEDEDEEEAEAEEGDEDE